MNKPLITVCLSLFLALICNSSFSSQPQDQIDIDSYRIFITNLEENIQATPDINLSKSELRKVMGLRTEILVLLADASSFQLVSDEQLELVQALNGEIVSIMWREGPSPMVELFDSEREINYIFNIRNPVMPSWITQ